MTREALTDYAMTAGGRAQREVLVLASGRRLRVPVWARAWLNEKLAKQLSPNSIQRYVEDLQAVNMDLHEASELEIKARFAILAQKYSKASLRRMTITAKQLLKHHRRMKIWESIKLPSKPESRVVVYTKQEIEKLLKATSNLRDRLLITVLAETGARLGEIYNMKIKDVQFDQYSPIIWLRGKTGTRRRRVYVSKPDLLRYLEEHPQREQPDAKFWHTANGYPLAYKGIYKIIRKLGWKALNKPIYPHGFRHTSATNDVRLYTDQEMMIRFGWKRADMVSVYAHLSARDVEDKELVYHGLKSPDTIKEPLIETRICPGCRSENGPVALYCQQCNEPLASGKVEKLEKTITELRQALDDLRSGKLKVSDMTLVYDNR